jgi:hypothetical protein
MFALVSFSSMANANTLTWLCRNSAGVKFTSEQDCISFAEVILQQDGCSVGAISCSAVTHMAANFECTTQSPNCSLRNLLLWNVVPSQKPAGSASQTGNKSTVH